MPRDVPAVRPQRRIEVRIGIGADNEEQVVSRLREVLRDIEIHERVPTSWISGGPDSSLIVATRRTGEEESEAHRRYFREVDEWLEQEHSKREEASNAQ